MENTIDLNMSFDFDAAQFDGASLRNLVHMIYSREHLLNKATGGSFNVAPTLINLLATCIELETVEDFLQVLVAHDAVYGQALHGIEITSQHVRINGFGEAPDVRTLKAYGQLAVLMATRSRELQGDPRNPDGSPGRLHGLSHAADKRKGPGACENAPGKKGEETACRSHL